MKPYTIILFTENTPGVLYRIADLFLRRKINIESLTVSAMDEQNLARFTIVVKADAQIVEKIVKQLYRIIEVVKVLEKVDEELLSREVALIKVSAKTIDKRREVEDIARLCQAKISLVGQDFMVVEKAGTDEELHSLYSLLKPFGIKEYVRSGRIAVLKEGEIGTGKFGESQK
jgi:acetolactate synthase I/III small subunit